MVTLKLDVDSLTDTNRCYIRQLVGFYRGTVQFSGGGLISVLPKKDFNLDGLLMTLRSAGFTVEKV